MLVMAPNTSRHVDPENIERYSMGDISEEQAARIEEHLLVCEACRSQVAESDECVRSMANAARELRQKVAPRERWVVHRWTLVLAAAATLIAAVAVPAWYRGAKPEFAVSLVAMRGGDLMAKAPAGTALVLHPDLTGLPSSAANRVEVVDAVGKLVWSGALAGAKVPARRPGLYFVRVYSSGNDLLREYGLQVQ